DSEGGRASEKEADDRILKGDRPSRANRYGEEKAPEEKGPLLPCGCGAFIFSGGELWLDLRAPTFGEEGEVLRQVRHRVVQRQEFLLLRHHRPESTVPLPASYTMTPACLKTEYESPPKPLAGARRRPIRAC